MMNMWFLLLNKPCRDSPIGFWPMYLTSLNLKCVNKPVSHVRFMYQMWVYLFILFLFWVCMLMSLQGRNTNYTCYSGDPKKATAMPRLYMQSSTEGVAVRLTFDFIMQIFIT